MDDAYVLFVGSCNRPTPYFSSANGSGLSVFSVSRDTLEIRELGKYSDIENPTYLSLEGNGRALFVTSEVFGWREGLITAFTFDRASGKLEYRNTQSTLGSIAAQSIVSGDGGHVLVVNYGIGTGGPDQSLAVYPVTKHYALQPATASVRQMGSGPDLTRQERSHAHSVIEIGDDHFVVADLGCDTLTCYQLIGDRDLVQRSITRCVPGAGPRHMALHPSGRFLFVMNELNSTCASFEIDKESGSLAPIASVAALSDANFRENHCADIQISPDGRFLYGSNRGHDSISTYAISKESGDVSLVENIPCGGKTPRNLAITPFGKHLFCANQDSDRIDIFERDQNDGRLIDTGKYIQTGTPTCIKFHPLY